MAPVSKHFSASPPLFQHPLIVYTNFLSSFNGSKGRVTRFLHY
ncbi:hypothetical protein E2C01_054928 [Portunus trituberculatus]|uniref:Uncharacterized protein n=1 Tax=Portunus trituberculatus TaxID=210409 RepID=A0A5B7GKX6_PORTR|nr:hypothetical protein [Portunus trituberculatus]